MQAPPPRITVFISHSSVDAALAAAVADLLSIALPLSKREIRCTSIDTYKLPAGTRTDDQLRHEILSADTFVGLITPASAKSAYVLFEIGARWGANLHLIPVVTIGGNVNLLGPLSGYNALDLSERKQVFQFVQDIAARLQRDLEPIGAFEEAVDTVVRTACAKTAAPPRDQLQIEMTDNETRVLQFLASVPDAATAEQIADYLGVSHQKAMYFLEELEGKELVDAIAVVYEVTTYSITQKGRRLLVGLGLL